MSKKDIKKVLKKVHQTPPFQVTDGGVNGAGHKVTLISNRNFPEAAPIKIITSSTPSSRSTIHNVRRNVKEKIWDEWGISILKFMNFIPNISIPPNPQTRWDNLIHILTEVIGFDESHIIYDDKDPPPLGISFIVIVPTDTLHSKRQQTLLEISGNYAILAGAYVYPNRKQMCGLSVFLVSQQKAHLKYFKDNLSPLGQLRY